MKRILPLVIILAFAAMLIGSIVLMVLDAKECEERGGVAYPQLSRAGASCVVRPFGRSQTTVVSGSGHYAASLVASEMVISEKLPEGLPSY